MRKFIAIALCILLSSPALTQAQTAGGTTSPLRQSPAVKNSFQEVTSYLDPGGNMYIYLSTEEWLNGLSTQISQLRGIMDAIPGTSSSDKQSAARFFDLLTNLVKHSGVEEISGFGMSSIALEK